MKTILLVEDTSSILMVYEALLTKAGFTVTSVVTGEEGNAAFKSTKFDVVLVDLSLPDYDGLDLLKEFLKYDPLTKAIVVTANGSMNKAVEAMRLGAYDFLVKPIADQKLLETVDLALASNGTLQAERGTTYIPPAQNDSPTEAGLSTLVGKRLEEVERAFIEETIACCNGSLPKAADLLGLAPSTLYRKRQNWVD